MKNIIVKQDDEKEVSLEIMAESIVAISEGIKKLRSTRLNDKALFLLIQYATPCTPKPSIRDIRLLEK